MTRPAPHPEPSFAADLYADRRDTRRANLILAAAITFAVLVVCAAVWWFDRVASPPVSRPTIRRSWVAPFADAERHVAIREMPEDAGR